MNRLIKILMERDNMTFADAKEIFTEAQEMVKDGADPEEVLHDDFGLEPDFVYDLLDGIL